LRISAFSGSASELNPARTLSSVKVINAADLPTFEVRCVLNLLRGCACSHLAAPVRSCVVRKSNRPLEDAGRMVEDCHLAIVAAKRTGASGSK
jgi:hypothetical protein